MFSAQSQASRLAGNNTSTGPLRPNQQRRVVITGIGLVSPLGAGREITWSRLIAGDSAVTNVTFQPTLTQLAAHGATNRATTNRATSGASNVPSAPLREVPFFAAAPAPGIASGIADGFAPGRHGTVIVADEFGTAVAADQVGTVNIDPRADRLSSLVHAAAAEALAHAAAVPGTTLPAERCGCVIGTSKGSFPLFTHLHESRLDSTARNPHHDMPRSFDPWTAAAAGPAASVARRWNLQAAALCPVAACATGLLCVAQGAELVARGELDLCLAGSGDASLHPLLVASFRRLGVLATASASDPRLACKPFDAQRSGFVIGEGAAVLVLEPLEQARQRGIEPIAEFLSSATAADPAGMLQMQEPPTALAELIQLTVARSGLTPDDIDLVGYHGTGTRHNDRCESAAIERAFGDRGAKLRGHSLKAAIGHLLGAAGSLELAICCLALQRGIAPPTLNLQNADADCRLDYTPNRSIEQPLRAALKLSLGFGGHLAAAVLGRVESASHL